MPELILDDFIEVDAEELATGLSIDTTQLEEDTKSTTENKTETSETKEITSKNDTEKNLIETDDVELSNESTEKDSKVDTDNPTDHNEDSEPNPFQAFTELLKTKGVFPNIEDSELENVSDADEIVKLLNKQIGIVNNHNKNNYTKNLVQNLINDGIIKENQLTNKPVKQFTIQDVTGNEDNAKQALHQFYSSKDIPESQIQTIIDGLLDLEEEAVKIIPLIEEDERVKNDKLAQEYKNREEQQLTQQSSFNEKLKSSVYGYEEFIPGRKLTDEDKQEVFENIPLVLEKINKDLGKYAPILSLLNKYEFLDGNMDKVIKEATTKNVDAFTKTLMSKKRGTSTTIGKSVNEDALNGFGVPQIYK